MKLLLGAMFGVLVLAELAAHLWFQDRASDFVRITAKAGVRTESLKDEAVNDLLTFDEGNNYLEPVPNPGIKESVGLGPERKKT